ncbi:MAG: CS1-pili formation C-terminal domain-containing protein [Halioglobus sp.]
MIQTKNTPPGLSASPVKKLTLLVTFWLLGTIVLIPVVGHANEMAADFEPLDNSTNNQDASEWVPEGFEALNDPQETLVDVFYGGYFLVSIPASFTPSKITILEAGAVVDLIYDVINPEQLNRLLASPLDTNPGLACRSKYEIDCGHLSTDTVAAIFDISKLRLDLFIGSSLLKIRSLDEINFLPGSDAGFSILDDFALNASGSTEFNSAYNMANTTLLGYRESRVRVESNYSDVENYTIDTLAFERERNGRDYKAGIFRTNAGDFVFMQNQQFLGATFESSLVTRRDLEFSLGSPITVFLDSRSLVQLFKDGRLVNSGYYDTGNQELNPYGLPSGSYELDIVITDSSGRTRTETQFYSKSAKLPPIDQPLYFIQAGEYAESTVDEVLPELLGENFIRAGISKRLSPTLAGRLGFSSNRNSTMAEGGFFHQGLNYELQATAAVDEYSVSAIEFRGRYQYSLGEISAYTRRISSGSIPIGEESQLGEEVNQTNISSSFRTKYGYFTGFANLNENNESTYNKSYGIRWSSPSFFGLDGIGSSIELSNNEGNGLFLVQLTYRSRRGAWNNTATAEYKYEEMTARSASSDIRGGVSTAWRSDPRQSDLYEATLRADSQENDTIESGLNVTSDYGVAGLTTKYNLDTDNWEYSGAVRTSFAATSSAAGFGGRMRSNSGFLVSVKGAEDADIRVNVMVNGSKQATIALNSEVYIAAAAYETYELEFVPTGNSLATVNYKSKPVTLYPGNVIDVKAQLEQMVVALGKVVDDAGGPVENALLKGVRGLALTDERGYFQAEIDTGLQHFKVVKSGRECNIKLPEFATDKDVIMLGELKCIPQ